MIGIRCQPHMNNCAACRNPKCAHECHIEQDPNERAGQLHEAKNRGSSHKNRKGVYWMANPDQGEEYTVMRRETA